MDFFHNLNRKLDQIASKPDNIKETVTESIGSTSGFLEGSTGDYSAKKARAGKDIGKPGKMFSKIAKSAGERYGSKERGEKVAGAVLAKLRKGAKEAIDPSLEEADMEEGNEFSGALAKAKASGAKSFEVDGKEYPVKEGAKPDYIDLDKDGDRKETMKKAAADAKKEKVEEKKEKILWPGSPEYKAKYPDELRTGEKRKSSTGGEIEKTATGIRHTAKAYDDEEDTKVDDGTPKKRGRPKGKDKGPERVTAKAWKHKGGRKQKTEEDLDTDGVMMNKPSNMSSEDIEVDSIALTDKGEYDQEGDMAKDQLHTLTKAAEELASILDDDQNLPEWVQSKITKALDYIKTANDYMDQEAHDADEPIAEKAVSQQQQKFMGMVHAMQKGEKVKGASKELKKVAKEMPKKAAKDYATTKHAGLPKKVSETDSEPKAAKSKSGYQFGKGVYESLDQQFKQVLNEGMNITVNMGQDENGQPNKNITVSADGDDAEALAALLKMAGLQEKSSCGCGQTPCGCQELDENSPDWPTNTETSDDAMQYSGGLNGPKSTGQTTVPVIASQLRRQVSMEESVELERSLFQLYQNYKVK